MFSLFMVILWIISPFSNHNKHLGMLQEDRNGYLGQDRDHKRP